MSLFWLVGLIAYACLGCNLRLGVCFGLAFGFGWGIWRNGRFWVCGIC